MTVWGRAREGRITAFVGAPPRAPSDLPVVRCRCGAGLPGLLPLVHALELPHDTLVGLMRAPLAHRLLADVRPPEPSAALVAALRRQKGERAFVLSQVERVDAMLEPVVQALVAAGDVPVVLLASRTTPLLETVRDRYGSAALVEHGAPQTPLAALPTDVLQVLVAAAVHDGPCELDDLARLCMREPHEILASLQGAVVRGIPVEDDGDGTFTIDPDILEELAGALLPTWKRQLARQDLPSSPQTPSPLELGRCAVALGAWDAARGLLAGAGPTAETERIALAWADGDAREARDRLDRPDATDLPALLGVLWDLHELAAADAILASRTEIASRLDRVALDMKRGRHADARTRIEAVLPETRADAQRCTALHLSARLALLEPEPRLSRARLQIAEALTRQDERDREARLLETDARLALRQGDPAAATQRYLMALPLLQSTGQTVALARATLGLARAADLDLYAGDVLSWLDRAVRANRSRAEGLVWCRDALQHLMEQLPVSSRSNSLTDLRRLSLELAALVAQFRQLPAVEPL